MSGWRFHALRLFPERTWLHRDLPLRDVSITPTLSGPQALTATLDPDTADLQMPDGRPLLQDWNTFIVAEADDIVRGGGILVQSTFTGESWALEIAGFTHHAQGQAMTKTLVYGGDNADGRDPHGPTSGAGVSPIEIVMDLWAQVQSKPNSDLGVTFGGDLTSKYKFSYWHNVPAIWNYAPNGSTQITFGSPKIVSKVGYENVKIYGTGFTKRRKTKYTAVTEVPTTTGGATDEPFKVSGDDKAGGSIPAVPGIAGDGTVKNTSKSGRIFWDHHTYFYENTDIGAKIDEYATEAPFDYIERLFWADADKTDVVMRLDFGYPRLGGRKTAPRFVEGENIYDVLSAVTGGDDYANAIIALGAGDGADQLRAEAFVDDGRLRVEKVVTATQIADKTRLKSYAEAQLQLAAGPIDVTAFTVKQHDNAKIGSFDVGDDVQLQLATGWQAGTKVWVRITSMGIVPDSDEVQVTCKRSDSFSYAGG